MIQGQLDVIQAFERLERADWSPVAVEIVNRYEEQIYIVDAIDTGRFIQSIDWRESVSAGFDRRDYFVDSSSDSMVTYDGFVEGGTKYMAARYPARRALQQLYLGAAIESVLDRSLGGFHA